MKYMGSKRELLQEIRRIVENQEIDGKAVLDLFAGTCGVGMALRDLAPIYSNDIQRYSSVIARGCLELKMEPLSKDKLLSLIEKNYRANYDELRTMFPYLHDRSEKFKLISTWADEDRKKYINFAESFGLNVLGGQTTDEELELLKRSYEQRQIKNKLFPYLQTTVLFSEMYFSIDQAMAIDSIRYAIDNLEKPYSILKDSLLTALIHAYSYASAGTGHFAQFRDLSTISSINDVFIYRKKSVLDIFLRKAEEILLVSQKNDHAALAKSFSKDYVNLLDDRKIMANVGLIYADPPYSFVHYSRFYHATEDLCRYDYPDVEHKGRYRKDRHQSPFCIKTKAPSAFNSMFKRTYKYRLPLLVSYSNTGMITLAQLDEIAKHNNYNIVALEVDHRHSTMGRLKDKDRGVKEALLLCTLN